MSGNWIIDVDLSTAHLLDLFMIRYATCMPDWVHYRIDELIGKAINMGEVRFHDRKNI